MTDKLPTETLRHYENQQERAHRSFSGERLADPSDEIYRLNGLAQQAIDELRDAQDAASRLDHNPIAQKATLNAAIDRAMTKLEAMR